MDPLNPQGHSHQLAPRLELVLSLAREKYQQLNRGSAIHEHSCAACGRIIVCWCNRREREIIYCAKCDDGAAQVRR